MTSLRTLNFELFEENYSKIWKKYVSAVSIYDKKNEKINNIKSFISNISHHLKPDDVLEFVIQEQINIFHYYFCFLLQLYERKTNNIDNVGS